jgi:excisionase family DNA binding protein
MITRGELPAFRAGKLLRISVAAVEEYERRQTV